MFWLDIEFIFQIDNHKYEFNSQTFKYVITWNALDINHE